MFCWCGKFVLIWIAATVLHNPVSLSKHAILTHQCMHHSNTNVNLWLWHISCLWLNMIVTRERNHYTCNIFTHQVRCHWTGPVILETRYVILARQSTHLTLVLHICVSQSGQLVAYAASSYHLNQCWVIINWTRTNKLQWNFNQNITFHSRKCIGKHRQRNGGHFVQGEMS